MILSLSEDDLEKLSIFLKQKYEDFHSVSCGSRLDWYEYLRQHIKDFEHSQLIPSQCAIAVILVAFQSACVPIPETFRLNSWRSSFESKFDRLVKHIIEVLVPDVYEKVTCSRLIRKRSEFSRALKLVLDLCGLCYRLENSLVPLPICLDRMFEKIDQQSAKRRKPATSFHSKNIRKLQRFLEGSSDLAWARSGSCVVSYDTLRRYQHIQPCVCLNVHFDSSSRAIVITSGFFDVKNDMNWTPVLPKSALLTEPAIQEVYRHFSKLTRWICPANSVLNMTRDLRAMDQYRIVELSYDRCCNVLRHICED